MLAREKLLRSLLILTYITYSCLLLFLYRYLPLCPDHFDYEYIAQVCLRGGSVYNDAGDLNFPGAVALHVLARLVFGDSIWSYRTLDFINLFLFCLIICYFIYRRQDRLAALIFLPLYQAMYVVAGTWMAGERDLLATHLVLASGFLFLRRIEGGPVAWLCGAGALVWLAMLMKPTYLGYLAILFCIDLSLRGRTGRGLATITHDHALLMLGVGALSAILACWGWSAGVLDDWFDMAILLNTQSYAKYSHSPMIVLATLARLLGRSWLWYTALALAGGILWWRSGDRPSLLVILGALAMVLGSALAQRKGFDYHFGGVLPVLGILSANCLARLARAATSGAPGRRPLMGPALAAVTLGVLIGLGSKFSGQYRRQLLWHMNKISIYDYFGKEWRPLLGMAAMAQSRTSPGDTILGWDDATMMIPAVAHRAMPVRFVPPQLITFARPPFRHARRWQDEWESALRSRPPRLIILPRRAWDPWPDGPRAVEVLRAMIEKDYRVSEVNGDYTCFERVR
jgi:hypothetical protein